MEEIREAIFKLQTKFRELVAFDDAMKDVINCHSKNMEALKNLTLAMNNRVNALEENQKDKENPCKNDLILVK